VTFSESACGQWVDHVGRRRGERATGDAGVAHTSPDYWALHAYSGGLAARYDEVRLATWRRRLVDRLEWRLISRSLAALMASSGRLASVIDVPAGTGRIGVRLKSMGLAVVAVDASADMLAFAEDAGAADRYVIGRIEHLSEVVESTDCVVSLRLFGHLPLRNQAEALHQVRRVARFGAVVCYAADTRWLRLRRTVQGRMGRTFEGWTPATDRAACQMAAEAGFQVLGVNRLLGPVSETHALVLRSR
jgi:SAM-dependent methyltransferase